MVVILSGLTGKLQEISQTMKDEICHSGDETLPTADTKMCLFEE